MESVTAPTTITFHFSLGSDIRTNLCFDRGELRKSQTAFSPNILVEFFFWSRNIKHNLNSRSNAIYHLSTAATPFHYSFSQKCPFYCCEAFLLGRLMSFLFVSKAAKKLILVIESEGVGQLQINTFLSLLKRYFDFFHRFEWEKIVHNWFFSRRLFNLPSLRFDMLFLLRCHFFSFNKK